MTACDEFREALWEALDAGTAALGGHEAGCAACRAYARRALRLDAALRSYAPGPVFSLDAAVLARLARAPEPAEGRAALAGSLAAAAALAGLMAWWGLDAGALLDGWRAAWAPAALDGRPWLAAWARAAARPPAAHLAWAAAGAALLWLSTHRPLWGREET